MRALCTSACHVELFARKIEAVSVRKCVRIAMAGFGKDKKIELNWQNEIENKVTLLLLLPPLQTHVILVFLRHSVYLFIYSL